MTFQMQQESDALARLEFNMGTDEKPVWIGNVKLEEIEAEDPYHENDPKTPLRNGNHVYNGTFDQGRMDRLTYWDLNEVGGNATMSVSDVARELKLDIANGGTSERSEEHTSELQSRGHLVCRLLLEKKKKDDVTSLVNT